MEKMHILPQKIYKFKCDSHLTEKTLQIISKLNYEPIQHNYGTNGHESLKLNTELKETYIWFQDCIEQVRKDLSIVDNISITQSWATRSYESEWHHGHYHPYSIMSGIFYLTDSDAETWFSMSSIWSQPTIFSDFTSKNLDILHKNKTERNTLLIFPSSLYHSVNVHQSNEPRYAISFNTFFDKSMGNFERYYGVSLEIKE